jgi:hypothetical protein
MSIYAQTFSLLSNKAAIGSMMRTQKALDINGVTLLVT